MYAAAMGYGDIVELLTDEAGMQDENGFTALMHAAKAGAAGCVQRLLTREGRQTTTGGITALMCAAQQNRVECVKLLAPAEGRMQEGTQWTALMYALALHRRECALELAAFEAGMRDRNGRPPTYYALSKAHFRCVVRLLQDAREAAAVPPHMLAAFRGDANALLRAREAWREAWMGDFTALHFAVAGRQSRCIGLLVRDGKARQFFADKMYEFEDVKDALIGDFAAMLPVFALADESGRSQQFTSALFESRFAEARLLGPFASWRPGWALQYAMQPVRDGETLARCVARGKNVGLVFRDETILDQQLKGKRELRRIVERNPIYSKQIELARKQITKNTTTDKDGKQHIEEVKPEQ